MKEMTNTDDLLRVKNPCPAVLSGMNKEGENYFCKSCSKTIIDFRKMTAKEISYSANKGVCGIFTIDQLPGQQKMGWLTQVAFYSLTILSFLGFSVKPLNAQSIKPTKNTVSVDIKTQKTDTLKTDQTTPKKEAPAVKRKKRLFHKRKEHIRVGYI